ncbi:MAG: hypothetical protein AAF654_10975 [Myxococcota bacterium]
MAKDQATDERAHLLAKLIRWFEQYESTMRGARRRSERDRDYYDGHQWTEAQLKELEKRGQPAIVINRIRSKVNIIRGTEVRTRTDPAAMPRTPAHEDSSHAITDALRFVSDNEDFPQKKGRVADEIIVEGVAAMIVDVEADEDRGDVEIKLRRVPFDRFWFDPHSREPDFSDAKYLGTVTWMDEEDAIDHYKGRSGAPDNIEEIVKAAASGEGIAEETFDDRPNELWYESKRRRMRVVECYYQVPVDGELEWHVAHFSRPGFFIEPGKVKFVDERGKTDCPIVATSAYVDRQNQRYGEVRAMISPQDEINKRRSKSLHLLNTTRIVMEDDAVENVETARAQAAKPDGVIVVRPNARFEIDQNLDLAATHFQILGEAKAEIDQVGPNTAAATDTSVRSGRDRQFMQSLASMELEPMFSNLRAWQRTVFTKVWYRIRQYWPKERWLRIRDDEKKTGYRFVGLNRRMTKIERIMELIEEGTPPEETFAAVGYPLGAAIYGHASMMIQQQVQQAQQQGIQPPPAPQLVMMALQQVVQASPQLQEVMTLNDVESLELDIIIDEAPDTATIAQEEFERMASLAEAGLPVPPELLVEMSSTRHKDRLLEILEQQKAPNPMAQRQAELAGAQAEADVQKTQAQAQEAGARAAKLASEAQTDPLVADAKATKEQAEAMKAAVEAGQQVGSITAAMSGIDPGTPLA